MALSGEQIERYSRQILVPEIGGRGQERLLSSTVALCGESEGISIAANYLAAAGVAVIASRGDDPRAVTADFVLADTSSHSQRAVGPLALFEESDFGAWYSRNTTSADCVDCIVESGRAAIARASTAATSGANIAGAAVALDIMAELLELAAGGPASVVALSEAGTVREAIEVSFENCTHGGREAN